MSKIGKINISIPEKVKVVMSDMDARKQKLGGEVICKVF